MTKRVERARASSPAQRARLPRGRARHSAAPTQPGRPARSEPQAASSVASSQVPVAEQARRARIQQGLPPTIQDPATLAYIARLLLPTIGKPHRSAPRSAE
jgi:hypothetical protein